MILLQVDAEKGPGPELAGAHRVRGYPTFVLVNGEGEEVDRLVGYGDVAPFVAALDAALADPVPVSARESRLRDAPSAADAAFLGRVMSGRGDPAASVAYYRQARALDPRVDYAFPIFEAVAMGFRRKLVTSDELRAAADGVLASDRADPEQMLTVGYRMSSFARRAGDPSLRHPYLQRALDATVEVTDADLLAERGELLIEHALHVARNRERALDLKRQMLPQAWRDDPEELNGFAWWCFENRLNLAEAEALALRGAELAADDSARAAALDTAAEISAARGQARRALKLARQAAQASPESDEYRRQVERFRALARAQDSSR